MRNPQLIAAAAFFLACLLAACRAGAQTGAQKIAPICHPTVSAPIEVATSRQRYEAGLKAQPPITQDQGFDWPDGPVAALKTNDGYYFFSIDAGTHFRQLWHGQWVGNNNSGSVVRSLGTLDNPLGSTAHVHVVIDYNPDLKVNLQNYN